jgi:membrane protease YdiL (CAAX protease family)
LQRLIVALLLPLFATLGWFLPSNIGYQGKWLFVFFLSLPSLVIIFFIKGKFERFFFGRKKWKKTWDNERRIFGLAVLVAVVYVLLVSFAYFCLIGWIINNISIQ